MASRSLSAVFAVALCGSPLQAASQVPPVDEAVFVVRANDRIVGEERFILRRSGDTDHHGLTLSVTNTYPHNAAIRTLARLGPRRIVIRIETVAGETAREYPNRPGVVLADDWVLGLYALAGTKDAGRVRVYFPRTGTRAAGTLEDVGIEDTAVGTRTMPLRHLVLRLPDDTHHLWFDDAGRLMRVAIPSRAVIAERRIP